MWATLDEAGPGLRPGAAASNRCGLPGQQASVRWMAGPDTRVGGPDTRLAQRLAAGDDHALAEIFDRLAPAVYGAAVRVLGEGSAAQDVVQDVFVELWRDPARYDPATASLRTFLTLRARHRAVDLVRSELRRVARQERQHRMAEPAAHPLPFELVAGAEAARVVRDAVALLPDNQRQVVELAYYRGLTCREVALAAGIPEGTAKSRLRLALGKLETMLDRQLLESS